MREDRGLQRMSGPFVAQGTGGQPVQLTVHGARQLVEQFGFAGRERLQQARHVGVVGSSLGHAIRRG